MNTASLRVSPWIPSPVERVIFYKSQSSAVSQSASVSQFAAVSHKSGLVEVFETEKYYPIVSVTLDLEFVPRCLMSGPAEPDSKFPFRLFAAGLAGRVVEFDLIKSSIKYTDISYGGSVWGSATVTDDVTDETVDFRFAIACNDGAVREFKINDFGFELYSSTNRSKGVKALSICYFGIGQLFVGYSDGNIQKWTRAGAKFLGTEKMRNGKKLTDKENCIWTLASILDESIVISGDAVGQICVWDANVCTLCQVFETHTSDIRDIAVSPDRRMFVTANADMTMAVFEAEGHKEDMVFTEITKAVGFENELTSVDWSPTGAIIVGCADGQLSIFDEKKKKNRFQVRGCRPQQIRLNQLLPVNQTISMGNTDGVSVLMAQQHSWVEIFCFEKGDHLPSMSKLFKVSMKPPRLVKAAVICNSGKYLLVSDDGGTRLFEINISQAKVTKIECKKLLKMRASKICFSGGRVLLNDLNFPGRLMVFDLKTLKVKATFQEHDSQITIISVTPGGSHLAVTASLDGRLVVYDLDGFKAVTATPSVGKNRYPTAVSFDETGSRLVYSSSSNKLSVFNIADSTLVFLVKDKPRIKNWTRCSVAAPYLIPPIACKITGIYPTHDKNKMLLIGHKFICVFEYPQDTDEFEEAKIKKIQNKRFITGAIRTDFMKRQKTDEFETDMIIMETPIESIIQKMKAVPIKKRFAT
eukprot:GHVL01035807.1.p1 GENE.GHVL01035807.1~~GHVL01035807.1.p1  ORF type:complete len:697 (+),score=129.51 GHVL01035807.1:36-2126(+)